MNKFKVKITRKETYVRTVEVEAKDLASAIARAKEAESNNEYYQLFDCPDDVKVSFEDGDSRLYRLSELLAVSIDSWVEAMCAMSGIDKVRLEACKMAGFEEDSLECPAEFEKEYKILADRYGFRFDCNGRIAKCDLTQESEEEK